MRKSELPLFSETRANLLSALVLCPDRSWYLSDLAKHLHVTPSTLQREVQRLTKGGILERRTDGNRVYFKADERCPYLSELQGILLKTTGLVDVVAECLKSVRKRIQLAAIFGSVARGEELSRSDVDLLIVGDLGLADLSSSLKKAETRLQRDIQAMIYRPAEFQSKLAEGDHFVTSVINGKILSVIGDVNDYLEAIRK